MQPSANLPSPLPKQAEAREALQETEMERSERGEGKKLKQEKMMFGIRRKKKKKRKAEWTVMSNAAEIKGARQGSAGLIHS